MNLSNIVAVELGWYRYLESVFGIFVGIFSCLFGIGISEILDENSDVYKDLTLKAKDKDQTLKDQDKDKDQTPKDKD